ncbi:MAG: sulfate adenylyltransferase subunit CysD [Alphaproteobacteria bacterium]|nr:MAG: sulfate adenylyltransferase subunit CysD [Alphaproteobacteria bacterium]
MASEARLTHLQTLEAESIHILREAAAETQRPVMLYSMGKDSGVLLHLAKKAFFPGALPFPLLHVDTTWKFRDMYAMRDKVAAAHEMIVYRNPDAVAKGVNPFDHGSEAHTQAWKTEGLRRALSENGFDAAIGGARRDEEKSRAKERIFSLRSEHQRWDPKTQRPELWSLYNTRKRVGESFRVFPLSNWTELDVWHYIEAEKIEVVPLYFSAERKVVGRGGTWLMADDERMRLEKGEKIETRRVRFRTLGCYPLSGAVESEAANVSDIIREIENSRASERQGRLIDADTPSSMEKKKQEGYF